LQRKKVNQFGESGFMHIGEKWNYYLIFILFTVLFSSCTSTIKPTSLLEPSDDEQKAIFQSTEGDNQNPPTINTFPQIIVTLPEETRRNKGICENRRGAALYKEFPPIDPDGKIAFVADGVHLIDPKNNSIDVVDPLGSGIYSSLTWSPDGTMLSVTHNLLKGGYLLEVVDFINGQVCSLLEGMGELSDPAWSPDGRNISVVDWESGELINVEISEMIVSILDNSVHFNPQWIDNSHISYLLLNSDTELSSLVSLDIQTQEKIEIITESRLFSFLFSPNGIKLAYSFWDQFDMNISTITNGTTKTVDAYFPLEWTMDGRTLLAEDAGRSLVVITLGETISVHPIRIGGVCTRQAFSGDDSMIIISKISDGGGLKTSFVIVNLKTNERKELDVPFCCPQYPVWNPNYGRES
jgi:hypothetical protein